MLISGGKTLRDFVTSWALASGLLFAGATPLSAQVEPSAPAPRKTEQTMKDQSGKFRLRTEEYTSPPISVPVADLSIADLYEAGDGQSGAVAAATVSYRCPVNDAGQITLKFCIFSNRLSQQNPIADSLVMRAGNRVTLPAFPVITQTEKERIARYVLLEFNVPAVELPVVDLSTGPLVEHQSIPELAGPLPLRLTYPPRALRQEAEGRSVIECQIQQDLSVICRQISFEPADDAALFARESERALGPLRVSPQLSDGSDARGVRFRLSLGWRLT